jgi:CP family cyanate transporter-like MFS transporter
VKISFPSRIAVMTSLYIFTMGIGSTLSSSLMVPLSGLSIDSHYLANYFLANLSGWQLALLFNLLFPIAALILWLPKLKNRTKAIHQKRKPDTPSLMGRLLKSPVAWQVTLAIGLNSFTFYSLAGWLPKILNDLGFSELDAGYIYGFLQFSTMIPGIALLPILAKKNNTQRLIIGCALSVVIASIGLLSLPDFAIFWVALFGLGNCSTFIIALSFIGLRTENAAQAASLSGMSQGIGYALAATGPTLLGQIHAQSSSWTIPLLLIALVGLACTLFAALAARETTVFKREVVDD